MSSDVAEERQPWTGACLFELDTLFHKSFLPSKGLLVGEKLVAFWSQQ